MNAKLIKLITIFSIIVCSCNNTTTNKINFSTKVIASQDLISSPFLGKGHIDAFKMLRSGAINLEEFHNILEERKKGI